MGPRPGQVLAYRTLICDPTRVIMKTMKRRKWLWIGAGAAILVVGLAIVSLLAPDDSRLSNLVAKQATAHGMAQTNDMSSLDPRVIRPESGRVFLHEGLSQEDQRGLANELDAQFQSLGLRAGKVFALSPEVGRAGSSGRAWASSSDTGTTVVKLICFTYDNRSTTLLVVEERKRGIGDRISEWFRGVSAP